MRQRQHGTGVRPGARGVALGGVAVQAGDHPGGDLPRGSRPSVVRAGPGAGDVGQARSLLRGEPAEGVPVDVFERVPGRTGLARVEAEALRPVVETVRAEPPPVGRQIARPMPGPAERVGAGRRNQGLQDAEEDGEAGQGRGGQEVRYPVCHDPTLAGRCARDRGSAEPVERASRDRAGENPTPPVYGTHSRTR
ncbi:hypothetical protein FHX33_003915 [Leifsonia aquatica]|uniref:Uncharacterized protein n=1 Tax=Leifsonia aquatica TaxID=144185 RepID=A0A7W4UZH5_LEIAQ|nr:hypothetical protein [Leifsonia aquatica]